MHKGLYSTFILQFYINMILKCNTTLPQTHVLSENLPEQAEIHRFIPTI